MLNARTDHDGYWARCRRCGAWHKVQPQVRGADAFFELSEAEFICCGEMQTARFTLEKDTYDFH
jgi:hypothetical protein